MAVELAAGAATAGLKRAAGFMPADKSLLSEANARRLAKQLSSLRGAAMKVGQMLSLQGGLLLPREFAQALSILRADADSMPVKQLNRILARAYGPDWEKRFRSFETTPIAAASIGQVHRAETRDGRLLALKIQYPGVLRSIDSDIRNVASLLRLARVLPADLDLSAILTEAKRQLRRETDYESEAAFQRRYRALVTDQPEFVVPRVHEDFTTKQILAMDFIEGVPLDNLFKTRTPQRLRDRVGTLLFGLTLQEMFEFRFMQTDPNFANYLFLPATRQIALLDFGSCRRIQARLSQNYLRLLRGGANNDLDAIRAALHGAGFTRAGDPPDRVDALAALFHLGCEPFRSPGKYDCRRSTMPARARDAGFSLVMDNGLLRPPPPDTIFLHRKLAGMFLLCAQLGARVEMRKLLMNHHTSRRT